MKKIRVKLSFEWKSLPIERQTPNQAGEWGNCKFYINQNVKECDYWVVYGQLLKTETTVCARENTLLISDEPPHILQYEKSFTDQFANIISCHEYIQHKNNTLYQQGLPWHVGRKQRKHKNISFSKDYSELVKMKQPKKTKLLSVICSKKSFLPEYKKRMDFLQKLRQHFGDKIDVFGRGINEIEDKWDALAPYKYHIALENSSHKDYWSEKLSDVFLSFCYPIYYGCPNIHRYFDKKMLSSIDLTQPDKTISIIENIIKNNTFERSQNKILEARNKCLNQYNLFSLITNFIEKKEKIRRKQAKKNKIKIKHIACTSPNFFEIAKKSISTDHDDNYDVLKQYYSMVCRKQGLKGKLSFIKNFGLKNYFKIKTW